MNGQLTMEYYGIDSDGSLSNARTSWHVHGSWFDNMEEVNERINEELSHDFTISAVWESWD